MSPASPHEVEWDCPQRWGAGSQITLTQEEAIRIAEEFLKTRNKPIAELYNVVEFPECFSVVFEPVSKNVFGGRMVQVYKVTRTATMASSW